MSSNRGPPSSLRLVARKCKYAGDASAWMNSNSSSNRFSGSASLAKDVLSSEFIESFALLILMTRSLLFKTCNYCNSTVS